MDGAYENAQCCAALAQVQQRLCLHAWIYVSTAACWDATSMLLETLKPAEASPEKARLARIATRRVEERVLTKEEAAPTRARFNSMSTRRPLLRQVLPADEASPGRNRLRSFGTRDLLRNDDVDGAQPRRSFRADQPPRPEPEEVEGSRARPLHPPLRNRASYALQVHDIDGAYPDNKVDFVTNRSTNPLEPTYKLPSFKFKGPDYSTPLRKTNDVSDIDGATARTVSLRSGYDSLRTDDIPGARAGTASHGLHQRRRLSETQQRDLILDVSDIAAPVQRATMAATKRTTNPVSPDYDVYRVNWDAAVGFSDEAKPTPARARVATRKHSEVACATEDAVAVAARQPRVGKGKKRTDLVATARSSETLRQGEALTSMTGAPSYQQRHRHSLRYEALLQKREEQAEIEAVRRLH